jgi:hypothetical protein
MLDALTNDSTLTISVEVLVTIVGAVGSLGGVYIALQRRIDRLTAEVDDLKNWLAEDWGGGVAKRAGHKQTLESLRRDQERSRGAADEKRRRTGEHAPHKHPTMGPGHDTVT